MAFMTVILGGVSLFLFIFYIYKRQTVFLLKWFTCFIIVQITAIYVIAMSLITGPKKATNTLYAAPIFKMIPPLVGIKWDVEGLENLRSLEDQGCVVVANHQSALDVLGIFEFWPIMKNCVCIAKNSLFWVPPFGPAAYLCGTVFINRSQSAKARSKFIQLGKEMTTEGKKVFIFPEGTRNSGEELLPFKKGAFHIAKQNKVPILPIVFGPYDFLNSKTMWFGSGKVRISIMEPIQTDGYDVSELTQQVRKSMTQELFRLRKEIRSDQRRGG